MAPWAAGPMSHALSESGKGRAEGVIKGHDLRVGHSQCQGKAIIPTGEFSGCPHSHMRRAMLLPWPLECRGGARARHCTFVTVTAVPFITRHPHCIIAKKFKERPSLQGTSGQRRAAGWTRRPF